MMKTAKLVIGLLFLTATLALHANAQETISAEKKALIKELLVVTDARKNVEKIFDTILAQLQKEMPEILMQVATQNPRYNQMTAREQAALKKYIDESSARIGNRFRELLPQRIDLAGSMEQISYVLYDKFFTAEELKDLIAFYNSATGKKSITVMPQLMAEAMQQYSAIATPKILELMKEISEEEMKHVMK